MMGLYLLRFEPVGWAAEILDAATAVDLVQLPRLYTAAGLCSWTGSPEVGVGYAQTALTLEADPRYDGFETGWSSVAESSGHIFAGRIDRFVEISTALAAQPGSAHVSGLCGLLYVLPSLGRAEEAMAMAEETLSAARASGNPGLIAYALGGCGVAFTTTDPVRALNVLREALAYCREHRIVYFEGVCARDAAGLEAVHGDVEEALSLFDNAIDGFHRAGNVPGMAELLANLTVFFDRRGSAEVAATLWGARANHPTDYLATDLPATVARLHATLGDTAFDECAAAGANMELGDAVAYARAQIQQARRQAVTPSSSWLVGNGGLPGMANRPPQESPVRLANLRDDFDRRQFRAVPDKSLR